MESKRTRKIVFVATIATMLAGIVIHFLYGRSADVRMMILQSVALAAAGYVIVRTWFEEAIFADLRAEFAAKSGFVSELLGCSTCLSYWAALVLTLLTTQYDLGWSIVMWLLTTAIMLKIFKTEDITTDDSESADEEENS